MSQFPLARGLVSDGDTNERRLGIVGAGKMGTTIARAALAAGYDVAMSGSGAAQRIALIVDVLAPGARAVTTDEVVRHTDLIVLAVPTHRFRELPRDLFTGKVVIDIMNYWPPIDGTDEELATAPAGTSVVVQERFPSAHVVKSLNQLGYHEFEEGRRRPGAPDRIAIAAAGDDRDVVLAVLELIDRLGFDAVDAGPLSSGLAEVRNRHTGEEYVDVGHVPPGLGFSVTAAPAANRWLVVSTRWRGRIEVLGRAGFGR